VESGGGSALRAIAANFQPRNHNMEAAVALNLAFKAVEEIAFELGYLSAAQARHVDVITLGPSLIVVLLTLHVHEVEFVN
jgi:hypothetical protein